MATIITGNFEQQSQAKQALSDLSDAGFASSQTTMFFVNPAGQHDLYPMGGDEEESSGAEDAATGSTSGAIVGGAIGVVVGLATLPVLGPGAAIAAGGVGAYAGSLYGALGQTEDENSPDNETDGSEHQHSDTPRKSGMLVAVAAPATAQQDKAIHILRELGATDIERPDGTIVQGEWTDFNPLTPLRLVTV